MPAILHQIYATEKRKQARFVRGADGDDAPAARRRLVSAARDLLLNRKKPLARFDERTVLSEPIASDYVGLDHAPFWTTCSC